MKDWFCESVGWYVSTFWVEQLWHRYSSCISIQTSWVWQEFVQLPKQCRLLLVIYFVLGMYVLCVHAPYVCLRTTKYVTALKASWLSNKVVLGFSLSVSQQFLPLSFPSIYSKIFSPSIILHMQQNVSSLAPCQYLENYVIQNVNFFINEKTKIVNQIT